MHKYINRQEFIALINSTKGAIKANDDSLKKYGNQYLGTFDNIDLLDETLRVATTTK